MSRKSDPLIPVLPFPMHIVPKSDTTAAKYAKRNTDIKKSARHVAIEQYLKRTNPPVSTRSANKFDRVVASVDIPFNLLNQKKQREYVTKWYQRRIPQAYKDFKKESRENKEFYQQQLKRSLPVEVGSLRDTIKEQRKTDREYLGYKRELLLKRLYEIDKKLAIRGAYDSRSLYGSGSADRLMVDILARQLGVI